MGSQGTTCLCRECGAALAQGAVYCSSCGAEPFWDCPFCGQPLDAADDRCPSCTRAVPHRARKVPPPSLAVAGFVCGVVGVCFAVTPFLGIFLAPAFGVAGTVLGAVGLHQARKTGAPTGLAIAALICGIIALVVAPALLLAFNGWA